MRKALLATLAVTTLLAASAAFAQNPNYDVGPVWEVIYYHVKPGQGDAFWKDFRENNKVVVEEYKKAGLITDYKVFLNSASNSPDDWDVALGLLFPNWAARDQIEAKGAAIQVKHYGSRDAMMDAAKKRNDLRDEVSRHWVREAILK